MPRADRWEAAMLTCSGSAFRWRFTNLVRPPKTLAPSKAAKLLGDQGH